MESNNSNNQRPYDVSSGSKVRPKEIFTMQIENRANKTFLKIFKFKGYQVFPTGTNSYTKTISQKHPLTKAGYKYVSQTKTLVPLSEAQKSAIRDAKQAIREIGMLAKRLKLKKPERPKMSAMEKRMRLYDMREDPRDYIKRMTQKGARTKTRGQKSALIQKLEDDKIIRELLEEYDKDMEDLDRELESM